METIDPIVRHFHGYKYRQVMGEKTKVWQGWYQHTFFEVFDLNKNEWIRLEGGMQYKKASKRNTQMTFFGPKCVMGYQLKWLFDENGFPYQKGETDERL